MSARRFQLPPLGTGRYVPAEIIEMVCDEELEGRPLAPVVELLSPRLFEEHEAEPPPTAELPKPPPTE
jgi:hypothetical protein